MDGGTSGHPVQPPGGSTTAASWSEGWLAAGLVGLGVGLAVNSVVGPLGGDMVDYPMAETYRNQAIGLDAVTLLMAAPLSVAAGVLVRRGHRAGPPLGVVVGTYAVYVMVQFIIGPGAEHYPGNLWLQLAVFVLGGLTAARSWVWDASMSVPDAVVARARRHAIALFVLAGYVVVRYLPAVPSAARGKSIPTEATSDPTMYWTIFLMDLGIYVPIVIAAGLGLRRGGSWAQHALFVIVGWFALVTLAVLAMSIVMVVEDDPYGSTALVALLVITAVIVITYAVSLARHLWYPSHLGALLITPHRADTEGESS